MLCGTLSSIIENPAPSLRPSPAEQPGGGAESMLEVDPLDVLFSYGKINSVFSGTTPPRTLTSTLADILSKKLAPEQLPAIAVIPLPAEYTASRAKSGENYDDDDGDDGEKRRGSKRKQKKEKQKEIVAPRPGMSPGHPSTRHGGQTNTEEGKNKKR